MQTNQTAAELAKEYEQLAIAVTNDYCRLKRQDPVAGFPAVAKAIGFYTTMNTLWVGIARRLAEGPEMYENKPDGTVEGPYGEYGV